MFGIPTPRPRRVEAHGTYVEQESAKGRDVIDGKLYGAENEAQTPHPDRLGLAEEHSLDSWLANGRKLGMSAFSRSSFPRKIRPSIFSARQAI